MKRHCIDSKVIFSKKKQQQYIASNNEIKYLLDINVTQGCILGPLFFLTYVNDVYLASELENVMFSDDSNLFISDGNIGK